jgi:hypothetical protein
MSSVTSDVFSEDWRRKRLNRRPASDGALVIRRRAYLGHSWEYTLDAPWGEILVLAPTGPAPLAKGQTVDLTIDPAAVIVLTGPKRGD